MRKKTTDPRLQSPANPSRRRGAGRVRCWKTRDCGQWTADSSGFTLMETMLAMALFAVVMASSYGVFNMGIQIWRRAQGQATGERKALIAMEKMGTEVRNILKTKGFKDVTFEGKNSEFSFPGFVQLTGEDGKISTQYGRITYSWSSGDKSLCRRAESASDLFKGSKVECRPLAKEITQLRFRYWLYDGVADGYSWYDSWDSSQQPLPRAVELTLEFKNPQSAQAPKRYTKVLIVAAGGKP